MAAGRHEVLTHTETRTHFRLTTSASVFEKTLATTRNGDIDSVSSGLAYVCTCFVDVEHLDTTKDLNWNLEFSLFRSQALFWSWRLGAGSPLGPCQMGGTLLWTETLEEG